MQEKEKGKEKPMFLWTQFASQEEAHVHPDTSRLVPLFQQEPFLRATGKQRAESQQGCSVRESSRGSGGNAVPWLVGLGHAAGTVDCVTVCDLEFPPRNCFQLNMLQVPVSSTSNAV